ncbi:MAG: hypothetical protein OEO21_04280 [Candidatus Krumholzibacteria bacterium]|nr:hypothetical protein [Candidatus Krumholzibacteria bacterium]
MLTSRSLRVAAGMVTLASATALAAAPVRAQRAPLEAAADTLVLHKPENFAAWSVYDRGRRSFVTWMTWSDLPDSIATIIHQPDTTGWHLVSPADSLSVPATRGAYNGDIDRTVSFDVTTGGGTVGQGVLTIEYFVKDLVGQVVIGAGYTPGAWLPVFFDNANTTEPDTVDFGLEISFGPGLVDAGGHFIVGLEDFEGYHLWRGIMPDGSDLEVVGELSKQEASLGTSTGGSIVDSVYFYSVLPGLRGPGTWFSIFGPVDCLGTRISLQLESDGMMWFDCNTFNGITYYYAVTTFDRGYSVSSGRQGLNKVDNCAHTQGVPYECRDDLVRVPVEVVPQSDLLQIYAVPNPFRTGGSRITTGAYHNFPDGNVRFVNVPVGARVQVFTVAGDLVWESQPGDQTGGNVVWNVKNRGMEDVMSGVYIFKVEDTAAGSMFGRLVIIR